MFEITTEVVINQPVEEVFNYIAENENDPQWCVPVVETTRVFKETPGVGARYTFASQVGLMKAKGRFETTGFEPPNRVEWTGESPFSHFSGYYQLEAMEGGAKLVETVRFENKGLFKLFESRMRRQFRDTYELQLQRLKQLLETG
jgi:uncharacterized protein YndB with AHSA1/START domain